MLGRGLLWSLIVAMPAWAEDAVKLDSVEVIGVTPVDTTGVALDRYPANAQRFTAQDLERTQAQSLTEYLARRGGSVFLSDNAGNPYQPDLFYRGYSISPVLGLPQGLAVYVDGVRVNEVFGDLANWDLIPEAAIDSLQLIPGSNPLFGLNSLAGALSLRTKSGFDAPGSKLELTGGSFGRGGVEAQQGYAGERSAFYVSGEYDRDDGWRDYSASRVARLFAKGSYADPANTLDLSVSFADNHLGGGAAAPRLLLATEGRNATYTNPDITRPALGFVNLQGNHIVSTRVQLSGGAHFRRNRTTTLNADSAQFAACADPANADAQGNPFLCADATGGERVISDHGGAPVVQSAANDSATINTSSTDQSSFGLRSQLTVIGAQQRRNRAILGFDADFGRARFSSLSELGALTASRGATGTGQFDADADVRLRTRRDAFSVFGLVNWAPVESLDLNAAASLTHTQIRLRDEGPTHDLDGDHGYTRLNPTVGASWHLNPRVSLFNTYSEAARAPTPVELTCADPAAPCRLPNGFVSDPDLRQVVTRTIEAGVRYHGPAFSSAAAFFDASNQNDILFITDGNLSSEGYFSNVGRTLRRGFEAGGNYRLTKALSLGLQYTYLDALFEEAFLVNSPNHPLRDPANPDAPSPQARQVRPGNRIPLIPRHLAKASVEWRTPVYGLGAEVQGRSNARFRGDEANIDPETVPGYATVNLYGDWKPRSWLVLFARVNNLFDRDYATFGVYGNPVPVLGSGYENERRFAGPGAPREVSAGLRLQF